MKIQDLVHIIGFLENANKTSHAETLLKYWYEKEQAITVIDTGADTKNVEVQVGSGGKAKTKTEMAAERFNTSRVHQTTITFPNGDYKKLGMDHNWIWADSSRGLVDLGEYVKAKKILIDYYTKSGEYREAANFSDLMDPALHLRDYQVHIWRVHEDD